MNKKEENARMLDPNRFRIGKNTTYKPGGPHNNNPMNVTDIDSTPIQAMSVNGDFQQNYWQQMGTGAVNPVNVQHSGLQQNFPVGQRNNGMPFGMQQQPDTAGASPATDGMESTRLFDEVKNRGVPAGAMGYQGMPAIPGGMPGNMPGTTGPQLMLGMPSAEQAAGGMNTRTGKRGK